MAVGLADGAVIPLTLWGSRSNRRGRIRNCAAARWNDGPGVCSVDARQATPQSLSECRVPAHDGYRSGWHPPVGFVATQAGVGAIRASQVLLGPTLFVGIEQWCPPCHGGSTSTDRFGASSVNVLSWVSVALAAVVAAYVALLLILPGSWGEHLLGDTRGLTQSR